MFVFMLCNYPWISMETGSRYAQVFVIMSCNYQLLINESSDQWIILVCLIDPVIQPFLEGKQVLPDGKGGFETDKWTVVRGDVQRLIIDVHRGVLIEI